MPPKHLCSEPVLPGKSISASARLQLPVGARPEWGDASRTAHTWENRWESCNEELTYTWLWSGFHDDNWNNYQHFKELLFGEFFSYLSSCKRQTAEICLDRLLKFQVINKQKKKEFSADAWEAQRAAHRVIHLSPHLQTYVTTDSVHAWQTAHMCSAVFSLLTCQHSTPHFNSSTNWAQKNSWLKNVRAAIFWYLQTFKTLFLEFKLIKKVPSIEYIVETNE